MPDVAVLAFPQYLTGIVKQMYPTTAIKADHELLCPIPINIRRGHIVHRRGFRSTLIRPEAVTRRVEQAGRTAPRPPIHELHFAIAVRIQKVHVGAPPKADKPFSLPFVGEENNALCPGEREPRPVCRVVSEHIGYMA